MTPRELVIAALEGHTPEKTPLTIYDWNMGAITIEELEAAMRQPSWRRLLDRGLSVRCHCPIIEAIEHGVEYEVKEVRKGGDVYRIETKTTPVGTIRKATRNGWHHEEWIKTSDDYKVQQWIVEHTELVPRYEAYERAEHVVGDQGVVIVTGAGNWQHRTPAMSINIDWAGTEQFCLDLAAGVAELFDLYQAARKLFLEEQRLIAAGPGRYVAWFENLTISMLGPDRYRELLASVYDEAVPIHVAANKRVMVHYDGALRCIADQIAAAPFHIIDSLTEPPEGDLTYDECRRLWPEKVFWANINVDLYYQPADKLRQAVIAKRTRAGKQAFAFEVSEDLPTNWQTSIPVVLDALEDLA
ncbi:MAG: hypothetical protein GXP27_05400 [Planctomycetes bacterium]|nr:hypothetical protein [Planctomycetota bacterium]